MKKDIEWITEDDRDKIIEVSKLLYDLYREGSHVYTSDGYLFTREELLDTHFMLNMLAKVESAEDGKPEPEKISYSKPRKL